MKRILFLTLLAVCLTVIIGAHTASAGVVDLYYLDGDNLYFDMDNMKNIESRSEAADVRYGYTGSSCYIIGVNGCTIKDMGETSYDGSKAPAAGYSADRVAAVLNHVYAIRCSDSVFGVIKITNCDNNKGAIEFMARLAEPEAKLKLFYMNGDYLRFDFDTMKNANSSQDGDVYFRYIRMTLSAENGASIKDLGMVDYETVKAPVSGYSIEDVSLVKDHVYAVRSSGKGLFVFKITNLVKESEVEFVSRAAEQESASATTPAAQPASVPGKIQPANNPVITPSSTPAASPITTQNRKEDLYWVENETRFVMGGNIIFEDPKGIIEAMLSPDKKQVIYTNGSYDLLMYDVANKTKKTVYELEGFENQLNYRVYPVGWSQDSKQAAFISSHSGGFIGGNQLCILNISDKKISVVAKGLSSADWGSSGMFAIANGKEVWLVDQLGRNKVTLTVPTANAFFGADNVSFTKDASKVIYIVADKYYLHDIKTNTYNALSIPEKAAANGTVRAAADGRIAVIEDHKIYIYNPVSNVYSLIYQGADSAYPNWIDTTSVDAEIGLLALPFKGTVIMSWDVKNIGDAVGYNVYRSKESGKYTNPLNTAPVLKKEFIDDKAEAGVQYYYIVKAVFPGNKLGKASNETAVMIK